MKVDHAASSAPWLRIFTVLSAVLVVAIGVLVLFGWALDIAVLKSILPIWVSMKVNTAFCFILLGVALILLTRSPRIPNSQWPPLNICYACFICIVVGLVSLLTLSEYIFGWNLGIDQFIFTEPVGTVGTSNPGRMAPETAFNFILLSVAILNLNNTRKSQLTVFMSMCIGLIVATTALAGMFTYVTPSLGAFGWFGLTIMAMHTAILFVMLGVLVVFASLQTKVFIWSLSKNVTLAFACAMALLVFIGLGASRNNYVIKEINQQVVHIEAVQSEMEGLASEIYEAQSNVRGYIITDEEQYKAGYSRAKSESMEKLNELRKLVVMNPHEQQQFEKATTLTEEAFLWYERVIVAKQNGVADTTRNQMVSHGQALLESFHQTFGQFEIEQRQNIQKLQWSALKTTKLIYLTIFFGTLTSLFVFITVIFKLNSNANERRNVEANLQIAATVFESQEAMTVADANGLILRVNHAFTNITGYTQAEVLGQNPRILQSGRHDKEFYTRMWESIHSTGTWQGEIWNRRKSGEVYPEYLNITAVKDASGIITNYVATFTDITQSKADSDEIKSLAFYDPLTQLPNRRLLIDRLQQALIASARNHQLGAVLFLDLDHFKTLNDTLGHDIGDLLLQQVAERLAWCVREGDTVARIGGDEFVVILEGLSEELFDAASHTETVANKILTSLTQAYQLGNHKYYNSPSIGVTLFNDHEVALEELLKQADIAMYDAKKAGRNTLRFFDPVMQESINARVGMEHDLRNAIAQHQFQLHYQIQVNHQGQPLGAEALIRWIHPERGMISPFNFIPLAEETGLILQIGQWVLEAACAQLKAWEDHVLTRELTISVNVSAKQFNQPTFVMQVLTTIQKQGINASLLKLELTESIIIENVDHIIITMVALEALGIRFELDDFGTGYSSLQYLKQLPLHQLKIDQSFVRDITSDSTDIAIVRTIIIMANSLGLQVIAEGVETEEQRQILLDNGCTNYQGYLFGRPLPIEAFEAALGKG